VHLRDLGRAVKIAIGLANQKVKASHTFRGITVGRAESEVSEDSMEDGQRVRAVTRLVDEHYEFLYRFAMRLTGSGADAEDLVQQAFLTAHAKYDQLREPDKARAWLIVVVRNAFRKSLRRDRPQPLSTMADFPEPSQNGAGEPTIDTESVQAALSELAEEFRTPLILFYFEEFSYKQIAEVLEVPIGTVMSRLSRGKEHLRSRLRIHEQPEARRHPAAR
jgi:RNA polymerase sigma-70 factor (ECF subfamily)